MMMMRLMTDDGDGVDDDEPKSSGFACLPPGDSFSYFSLMVKIMMMYVYDDDGYDDLYDYNNDHDGYDDDKDDDDDDDPVMEPRPCFLTPGQGCGGDAQHTHVFSTHCYTPITHFIIHAFLGVKSGLKILVHVKYLTFHNSAITTE